MAFVLEEAGFESVWCSDHVVMPPQITSTYPFAPDGRAPFSPQTPWYDTVVVMSLMAAATRRIEVGVSVLVLGLRHPVILAKQLASLDALQGGRVALGVGAGWLEEEFCALGARFRGRGKAMEQAVDVLRDCWSGTVRLPNLDGGDADFQCFPRPAHPIPVLVGGMSDLAVRRAGRIGDGWVGSVAEARYTPEYIGSRVELVRAGAADAGRDPDDLRIAVRVGMARPSAERLAPLVPELARVGVNELILDVSWGDEPDLAREYAILRNA